MKEKVIEPELSMWFSTYGVLTAERILERFRIRLKHDELITAVKNPRSLYYQLLRIPLKNVFNGIILQQAYDYQVYAQKLFIDFLLSGQNDKEPGSPGENTREDLTKEYNQLTELSEGFNQQEFEHQKLIAESQASLIKLSSELQKSLQGITKSVSQILVKHSLQKNDELIQKSIRESMIHDDKIEDLDSLFWEKMEEVLDTHLKTALRSELANILIKLSEYRREVDAILTPYLEKTDDMSISMRGFRNEFYQLILRSTELIQLLPDYQRDVTREEENRSTLNFDANLGEILV